MNKGIILFASLMIFTTHTFGQHILKIFINGHDVTAQNRWVIHPNDSIRFKLAGTANEKYRFDKVTFELLVKTRAALEHTTNRLIILNANSQGQRLIRARESDFYYLQNRHHINELLDPSEFSLKANGYLTNISQFSRIIVHIKKVMRTVNGHDERVVLDVLGDYNKFFGDGISFWAGEGFNGPTHTVATP